MESSQQRLEEETLNYTTEALNKWNLLISNLRKQEFMNIYSIWDLSDECCDPKTPTKLDK